MDSKLLVTRTHAILKEMGHEIPLGHVYELYSKLHGYKSWNVAKSKKDAFKSVIDFLQEDENDRKENDSIRLAKNALDRLITDSKNLPSVYQNFEEYLYDWFADLPWNEKDQKEACSYLLMRGDFIDVCKYIQKKYNYNLHDEIKRGSEGIVEQNEARRLIDDLDNFVNTNPSKEAFDTFIKKWFDEISSNWDSISDQSVRVLSYIKMDERFKSINNLVSEKYGNYLSVINDMQVG